LQGDLIEYIKNSNGNYKVGEAAGKLHAILVFPLFEKAFQRNNRRQIVSMSGYISRSL
jgi:hypothetical protein